MPKVPTIKAKSNFTKDATPLRMTMQANGSFNRVLNSCPRRFGSDMIDREKSLQVMDKMLTLKKERKLKQAAIEAEAKKAE